MDETKDVAVTVQEMTQDVVTTTVEQTKDVFHVNEVQAYFTPENIIKLCASLISILLFYIAYRIIKAFTKHRIVSKVKPTTAIIINKVMTYTFWVLEVMYILNLLGIKLSAIWGAAGVAGIAIGFAAQTSVSNIISGVFVLSEKAMKVGDFIKIGDESGTVDNVGLLSVKIHTLDNQMVRIPNSSIINGTLTNYNHFPIRRLTFDIDISYDSDMDKVLEALEKVPAMCPTVLQEPASAVYYDGFGDEGLIVKLCVWIKTSDLIKTKNDMYKAIIKCSNEAPFEIPYKKFDVTISRADSNAEK